MGLFGRKDKLLALVVEDEVEIRTMVGMFLQTMGLDVADCASGEHALRLAEERRPDLVILDIMLPGLSGYDVLTFLRGKAGCKDAAILMCTARRGLEDVERCLDAGADDYLEKPFEASVFRSKVERVLAKRGKKAS